MTTLASSQNMLQPGTPVMFFFNLVSNKFLKFGYFVRKTNMNVIGI
jgi:hypothetical protein